MRAGLGEGGRALIAAAGAGGLFSGFWLGIGLPLGWSAAAGLAAYAALWAMLKGGARRGEEEASYAPFVDLELAAATAAKGRAFSASLRALIEEKGRGHPSLPTFKRLAALLDDIAADVGADPKDAPAANSFIAIQGETALRLARLAFDLERSGASSEQRGSAARRLEQSLGRLEAAFRAQLARLQEDNLAELQAELDVLEQSLEWEEPPDGPRPRG